MKQISQIYGSPQKSQRPDRVNKTQIVSTTPPTIPPHSSYNKKILLSPPPKNYKQIQITHKKELHFTNQEQKHNQNCCPYISKIKAIQTYIYSHDQINKQSILGIIQHPPSLAINSDEYLILKQLNQKVKKLLQQNNELKKNRDNYQLLIKENNRNRLIIEDYKKRQLKEKQLTHENIRLKDQIIIYQRQISQYQKNNQFIIKQSLNDSPSKIQNQKNELNKTLQLFYVDLQNKNKFLDNIVKSFGERITKIQEKINKSVLQSKVNQPASNRKSKNFAQCSPSLIGDVDHFDDAQNEKQITNILMTESKVVLADQNKKTKLSILQQINKRLEEQYLRLNKQIQQIKREFNNEIKKLNFALKIAQEKNQTFFTENGNLKAQIRSNKAIINEKIDKISSLEKELSNNKNSYLKQRILHNDIKEIRESLQSCQPPTITAEKQLKELLKQRQFQNSKIDELVLIKAKVSSLQKQIIDKQMRIHELELQILHYQKSNLLLNKSIRELEQERDRYKSNEIKAIEISKVSKVSNLLEWQKMVKSKVKDAVTRLNTIQDQIIKDQK